MSKFTKQFDAFYVDTPPLTHSLDDVRTGTCEHCGEDYEQHFGDRFCDTDCKENYLSEAGKRYEAKPKTPKPCTYCDTIFPPTTRGNTLCSPVCRANAKREREAIARKRKAGVK